MVSEDYVNLRSFLLEAFSKVKNLHFSTNYRLIHSDLKNRIQFTPYAHVDKFQHRTIEIPIEYQSQQFVNN